MIMMQNIRYQDVYGVKIWNYYKKSKILKFYNAVFGQFWFLEPSGHRILFYIYTGEMIRSRSMYDTYGIPGDPD